MKVYLWAVLFSIVAAFFQAILTPVFYKRRMEKTIARNLNDLKKFREAAAELEIELRELSLLKKQDEFRIIFEKVNADVYIKEKIRQLEIVKELICDLHFENQEDPFITRKNIKRFKEIEMQNLRIYVLFTQNFKIEIMSLSSDA